MRYYLSVTEYNKWGYMIDNYLLEHYLSESEDLEELIENASKVEEDLKSGWKGSKDNDYYILISDNNDSVYYEKKVRL